MTQPQHTPGPWTIEPGDSVVHIISDDWVNIAVTNTKRYYQRHDDVDVANARLMAAAPTLLSAANEAFDFLGGVDGAAAIRDTLLAAILAAAHPKEINP